MNGTTKSERAEGILPSVTIPWTKKPLFAATPQPNAQDEFPVGVCGVLRMAKWHLLRNHSQFSVSYHHLHKQNSVFHFLAPYVSPTPHMSDVTLSP